MIGEVVFPWTLLQTWFLKQPRKHVGTGSIKLPPSENWCQDFTLKLPFFDLTAFSPLGNLIILFNNANSNLIRLVSFHKLCSDLLE